MSTNHIELNQVVYMVQRVYCGKKPVVSLIKDRLIESQSQLKPLTEQPPIVYNNSSDAGMSKEVK